MARSKHRRARRKNPVLSEVTALVNPKNYGIVKHPRRHYGMAIKNPYGFLPLIPIVGLAAIAGTAWAGWRAYDSLTRPAALVGTGVGVLAAYKYGNGWIERISYTAIGTGLGLVADRLLFPEE
jgi:hypothetical protein